MLCNIEKQIAGIFDIAKEDLAELRLSTPQIYQFLNNSIQAINTHIANIAYPYTVSNSGAGILTKQNEFTASFQFLKNYYNNKYKTVAGKHIEGSSKDIIAYTQKTTGEVFAYSVIDSDIGSIYFEYKKVTDNNIIEQFENTDSIDELSNKTIKQYTNNIQSAAGEIAAERITTIPKSPTATEERFKEIMVSNPDTSYEYIPYVETNIKGIEFSVHTPHIKLVETKFKKDGTLDRHQKRIENTKTRTVGTNTIVSVDGKDVLTIKKDGLKSIGNFHLNTLYNIKNNKDEVILGSEQSSKKLFRKDYNKLFDIKDKESLLYIAEQLDSLSLTKDENRDDLFQVLEKLSDIGAIPTTAVFLNKNKNKATVEGYFKTVGDKRAPAGIYITDKGSVVNSKTEMTALRAYVHEVVHSIEYYGLELKTPEISDIRRELEDIREYVVDNFGPEIFLNGIPKEDASRTELKRATKKWEYIQESLHEFMAVGLTDPGLVKILKETKIPKTEYKIEGSIFHKLHQLFFKTVNAILNVFKSKKIDQSSYDAMFGMMAVLGNASKIAQVQTDRHLLQNGLEKGNKWLSKKIDKVIADSGEKVGEKLKNADYGDSTFGKLVFLLRNTPNFVGLKDTDGESIGKNSLLGLMNSIGLSYDGITQHLVKNVMDPTDMERAAEQFVLSAGKIDNHRDSIEADTRKIITESFNKNEFTSKISEELFRYVVQADAQALLNQYTPAKVRALLYNSTYRQEQVEVLQNSLNKYLNKEQQNLLNNYMHSLVRYKIDGYGHEALLYNAKTIHTIVFGDKEKNIKKEHIATIDSLLSLHLIDAIDNKIGMSNDTKIFIRKNKNKDGIDHIVKMMKFFNKQAKAAKFKGKSENNMVKGYYTQRYNANVDIKYGSTPEAHRELFAKGYKKTEIKMHGDVDNMPVYLYINKLNTGFGYERQALRYTDTAASGTSLLDMAHNEARFTDSQTFLSKFSHLGKTLDGSTEDQMVAGVTKKLVEEKIKKANNEQFKLKKAFRNNPDAWLDLKDNRLSPTYSTKTGKAQMYRATMTTEVKEEIFDMDYQIENVMARTFARTVDLVHTREHNREVAKFIINDAKLNFQGINKMGKNMAEYEVINEDSERFQLLPDDTQYVLKKYGDTLYREYLEEELIKAGSPEPDSRIYKEIEEKTKKNYQGIPVRKDLINHLFGVKEFNVVDLQFMKMLPTAMLYWFSVIERIWQDTVSLAKTQIILKIPAVAIANSISNRLLTVQANIPFRKGFQYAEEARKDLAKYKKDSEELRTIEMYLETKTRYRPIKGQKALTFKQMELKVARLKEGLRLNSAHELIQNGGFLSLIEDQDLSQVTEANNIISRSIDNLRSKAPEAIQTLIDYVTLNENTFVHQSVSWFIQTDDFITKYTIYHDRVNEKIKAFEQQKRRKGTKTEIANIKKEAFYVANDSVINYNLADPRILQYANKMGFVFFTKFLIGIQRVIKNLIRENPLNMILMWLGQKTFGYDLPDILDTNVFQANLPGYLTTPVSVVDSAVYTIFELFGDVQSANPIRPIH